MTTRRINGVFEFEIHIHATILNEAKFCFFVLTHSVSFTDAIGIEDAAVLYRIS